MRRWVENEDWIEFVADRQLVRVGPGVYEALVNFGGPMARTPYHVYARVKQGFEGAVAFVEFDGEEFHADRAAVTVSGTPEGFRWVRLGHVESVRAYRRMTVRAPEGLDGLERLCVLQIPERLESGAIERRIRRELSGDPEPISGVPLGGVGAGKVEFCRDGLFRNITINGNIDAPIRHSDGSFFAVRVDVDGRSQARVVSTERLYGLPSMEKLEFEGAYPTALLRAEDTDFPLNVEVRATGPIIARNVTDSSLPLAMFTVRLMAKRGNSIRATVALAMENFLGCGGGLSLGLTERKTFSEGFYECWEEREGNFERPWAWGGFSGLLFDGGSKQEKRSEGQYVLATDSPTSSALTGWRVDDSGDVWRSFMEEGRFPSREAKPSEGERTAGAVAVDVNLRPGEAEEVRFVFAWHVPFFQQSPQAEYGHYYSNHFDSAPEVAMYGLREFERLWREAHEVPDLLLGSSLPTWFARTLPNDAFVLSSATWLTKDGRFAVNEGPTSMFGCMGTLDQKLYANHYYTLFFPELDRTELLAFARAQAENGGVQHDLGGGHLEMKGGFCDWPDLACALVILSLKHYQLSGDREYIDEVYPRLVRLMFEYYPRMDHDGDGLPDGPEVGNTFDSEHFEGVSCYSATVTLAALRSLRELAEARGDEKTASRCRETFEKACAAAKKLLWNGSYFGSFHNVRTGKVNRNCHISQVAGELFARLCGFGPLYDSQLLLSAMQSVLKLNYHDGFVFPTNEATPEGEMPSRHMWGWLPHVRACLGGVPMLLGMPEKGLECLERMDRAIGEVNGENRWDLRLFYEPDTGRQHWGRFYMSAPATWLVYQALLGYAWDVPRGVLTIAPNVPEDLLPLSAPVFTPGVWFWLDVSQGRGEIRLRVIRRFDKGLRVDRLRLPKHQGLPKLYTDGKAADARRTDVDTGFECDDWACAIDLDSVDEIRVVW